MPRSPAIAVAILSVLAAAIALWMQLVPLGGTPHVADEMSYLYQAANLEHLSLGSPSPGLTTRPPFTLVAPQHLVGAMPNGWPALLAITHILGLPYGWLNPLLLGLLVGASARLARRVIGPHAMAPAALLLALSPSMLLLGASTMNHTVVALCWVLSWDLVLSPYGRARSLALGALIGYCFLTRPLCGVALGVVLLPSAPRPLSRWLWAAPTLALAIGVQAAQNQLITGTPFQFPINLWYELSHADRPGMNQLGFGPDRGTAEDPGHDLVKAARNTWINLRAWGLLLLGPGGVLLALLGLRDRAARPTVLRWFAAALVLCAAYGLYWYVGTCYGARFYHGVAPLLILSATAGLLSIRHRLLRLSAFGAAAVASIGSLVAALPELDGYWRVDGRFQRLVDTWGRPPAIVLVEDLRSRTGRAYPMTAPPGLMVDRGGLFNMHSCTWPEAKVCMADLNDQNVAIARLSGRDLYHYEFTDDPAGDTLGVFAAATIP